eukprot:CAMPEP_0176222952 /NCGR_PEP_ID=MMETSP0121_2-20121125/20497_1 /TAXON_ID=160619 /ORGANISM="Kryptoperidinium foliaceum, Strain CCMP 1326" /LENGTH=298 /DNA_ID=CAMNT_0017562177 /DNA_START=145 /DNA_END=1038 /DNA_ORIENTATION=+
MPKSCPWQVRHWQGLSHNVVVRIQIVQRLVCLALNWPRASDKCHLQHLRHFVQGSRRIVHIREIVAMDMHDAEAVIQHRLRRLGVQGMPRLVVQPVELQDRLLELVQDPWRLGGQDRPLGVLDVHLHDEAAIRRLREARVLQHLAETPIVRARRGALGSDADLVELAPRARLPHRNGAVELVHRGASGAGAQQGGHVLGPLIVLLDAHGQGRLDAARRPTVHARQVAAVVGLAEAAEAVASAADPQRGQELPRDGAEGRVLAEAVEVRGDVPGALDQRIDLGLRRPCAAQRRRANAAD